MRKVKRLRITLNSFEVFDKEAFCQYLEQMADKGWMIKKVRLYLLEFEPCEPQSLVFQIDYETFKKESPLMDKEDIKIAEYIELCEASGWTFATFMEKGFIFYHTKGIDVEPLCTDESLHVRAYYQKTFAMYTILFIVLCYLFFHLHSIYEIRMEWLKSYDAFVWICWFLFFLPSMLLRCLRYYWYVIRSYIAIRWQYRIPKQNPSYRTIYRYYYRISQSLFLCTAIPLLMFIIIKTLSYEHGICTLLTLIFVMYIVGVIVMDVVLYHSPKHYKHRYLLFMLPQEILILALMICAFLQGGRDVPFGYQPITECAYTNGVLLPNSTQDVYCGPDSKIYYSFLINEGSTCTIYLKDKSKYTEFATSTVFDIKDEALSKEVLYDFMIDYHRSDAGVLDTTKLPRIQMIYPPAVSKDEILSLVQSLDTDEWQVDEAYMFTMKHQDMYAFRRGKKVFVYLLSNQIIEEEKLKLMHQALS